MYIIFIYFSLKMITHMGFLFHAPAWIGVLVYLKVTKIPTKNTYLVDIDNIPHGIIGRDTVIQGAFQKHLWALKSKGF